MRCTENWNDWNVWALWLNWSDYLLQIEMHSWKKTVQGHKIGFKEWPRYPRYVTQFIPTVRRFKSHNNLIQISSEYPIITWSQIDHKSFRICYSSIDQMNIFSVVSIVVWACGNAATTSVCLEEAKSSVIKWTSETEHSEVLHGWDGSFIHNYDAPLATNNTVTLIFGDSIDRMVVSDLCDKVHGTVSDWTNGTFQYKEGQHAAGVCKFNGGLIGFLHVFGSPLQVSPNCLTLFPICY